MDDRKYLEKNEMNYAFTNSSFSSKKDREHVSLEKKSRKTGAEAIEVPKAGARTETITKGSGTTSCEGSLVRTL